MAPLSFPPCCPRSPGVTPARGAAPQANATSLLELRATTRRAGLAIRALGLSTARRVWRGRDARCGDGRDQNPGANAWRSRLLRSHIDACDGVCQPRVNGLSGNPASCLVQCGTSRLQTGGGAHEPRWWCLIASRHAAVAHRCLSTSALAILWKRSTEPPPGEQFAQG